MRIKQGEALYIAYKRMDRVQLPIAVAGTMRELSELIGLPESTINSRIGYQRKGGKSGAHSEIVIERVWMNDQE